MTTPSAHLPNPSPMVTSPPSLHDQLAASFESSILTTIEPKPFPDPSTFTFLPDLYNLISHLSILQSSLPNSSSSNNNINNTNPLSTSSPNVTREKASSISTSSDPLHSTLSLTKTSSKESGLDIKDLPSLLYGVRQAIQNAREVVAGLPDVQRGVAEQEMEIRSLEGRIRGLKGRLKELGGLAAVSAEEGGEGAEWEGDGMLGGS